MATSMFFNSSGGPTATIILAWQDIFRYPSLVHRCLQTVENLKLISIYISELCLSVAVCVDLLPGCYCYYHVELLPLTSPLLLHAQFILTTPLDHVEPLPTFDYSMDIDVYHFA